MEKFMFDILSVILLLSMGISLVRFLRGPTLSDRIIAFDVLGIMGVSLLVILALYFQRSIYLDVALVFSLIGFLGTTIFGRHIEKGI
jgi:multisubunit Na+/H+ antiporter MnhF subunit